MELDSLNTLVDGFLTLAETRANSQKPTFMKDWKSLLYGYLELSQLPLLEGKGKVSSVEAKAHAINEYNEFRIDQDRNDEWYVGVWDTCQHNIKIVNMYNNHQEIELSC